MVAVGFVLLVLSGLLATGIVLNNREPVEAEAFGVSLENMSVGGLFLVGMVVGVVAMIGLAMMLTGAARRRAKRVAVKREVRDVRGEREDLAEENARLQAELERTAAATSDADPSTSGAPVSGAAVSGAPVSGGNTGPAPSQAPPTAAAARTVLPGHGDDGETARRRRN